MRFFFEGHRIQDADIAEGLGIGKYGTIEVYPEIGGTTEALWLSRNEGEVTKSEGSGNDSTNSNNDFKSKEVVVQVQSQAGDLNKNMSGNDNNYIKLNVEGIGKGFRVKKKLAHGKTEEVLL